MAMTDWVGGECADKFNLFFAERTNLRACQNDHTNGYAIAQKWHTESGSKPGLLRKIAHRVLGIPFDIRHMDRFAVQKRTARHASSTALMSNILDKFVQLRRIVVNGSVVIRPLVLTRDARHIRVAEPRRGPRYLVKQALEVESCATYELKNVGSGGLLFERLVTFASELREFAFLIDGWRFAAPF